MRASEKMFSSLFLLKSMKFLEFFRGRLKRSARAVQLFGRLGRIGDPCFEIIGASLLPCCVGFDAFSTLGI